MLSSLAGLLVEGAQESVNGAVDRGEAGALHRVLACSNLGEQALQPGNGMTGVGLKQLRPVFRAPTLKGVGTHGTQRGQQNAKYVVSPRSGRHWRER